MAATTTTDNQLFIVETSEPFSTMAIQFVPGEMGNDRSANFANIAVVGRNDEIQHYIGGSETLNLTLDLYGGKAEVMDKINWLKSLTLNDGYSGSFRSVKLVFGDLFKYQVFNITKVTPSMSHFTKELNWLPQRATVSISLKLDPDENRYIEGVRNGL